MHQAEQEDAVERSTESAHTLTAADRVALLKQLPSDTVKAATSAVEALNSAIAEVSPFDPFLLSRPLYCSFSFIQLICHTLFDFTVQFKNQTLGSNATHCIMRGPVRSARGL